jgi:RNA polymerase sigma-70 factor, ECF subfamily
MGTLLNDTQKKSGGTQATLGDVLYADGTISHESEKAWEALLQSIAARDSKALHALFERAHRIVYTLILRITGAPDTAEELTLQVFYDVWTGSLPSGETVVARIMNQARARAVERMRKEKRGAAGQPLQFAEQSRLVQEALQALTQHEREVIESAYFSDMPSAHVAARLNQRSGNFRTWLRSGVMKLRQALARNP